MHLGRCFIFHHPACFSPTPHSRSSPPSSSFFFLLVDTLFSSFEPRLYHFQFNNFILFFFNSHTQSSCLPPRVLSPPTSRSNRTVMALRSVTTARLAATWLVASPHHFGTKFPSLKHLFYTSNPFCDRGQARCELWQLLNHSCWSNHLGGTAHCGGAVSHMQISSPLVSSTSRRIYDQRGLSLEPARHEEAFHVARRN